MLPSGKPRPLPMVPGTTCGEELLRQNFNQGQIFAPTYEKHFMNEGVPIDYQKSLDQQRQAALEQAATAWQKGSGYDGSEISRRSGSGGRRTGGYYTKNLGPNQVEQHTGLHNWEEHHHIEQGKKFHSSKTLGGISGKTGIKMTKDLPISHTLNSYQQSQNAEPDLERQVLRFYAYFTEPVLESNLEKERVRKVSFLFFVEDGTMMILEPKQDNSGIEQGCLVKRHLIPYRTEDGHTRIVTSDMLNIGKDIHVYGRTFHIVDCDWFTRHFLTNTGVQVPASLEYPNDAFTTLKTQPRKVNNFPSIAGGASNLSRDDVRAAIQFYEHDRNVLRLYAVWDDSEQLYGRVCRFNIYYFLSDNTFALVQKNEVNSGNDPYPKFIGRQKMFKPTEGCDENYENLTAALSFEGLKHGVPFYTDADIWIGATLKFYGRNFLIVDYDPHTRDHLRENYNITEYKPMTDQFKPREKPPVVHKIPPYNGFGSEEDSLMSCKHVQPKAPRKDYDKISRFGTRAVRFFVKIDGDDPVNEIRRFVLAFYLVDDTIAIFEPVQRNSGLVGGKFLARQRVKNPKTDKYYTATDFYVGGTVMINNVRFRILTTDEHSLSYMEQNNDCFPHANIGVVAHKLQAMLLSSTSGLTEALQQADSQGTGSINYKELKQIINTLGLELSEQEILVLLRYFDRNGEGYICYEDFIARIIPEGMRVKSDPRRWQDIHDYDAANNTQGFDMLSIKRKVDMQAKGVENTIAVYAAKNFEEQYQHSRLLFLQEFKFICDYSPDGKISEREFRLCVTERLKLKITSIQLDALCAKLFPPAARCVEYDEFVRMMNNYSNFTTNLKDIWDDHLKIS